ncbi:Shiga toxin A subunit [Enterobacter sp. P82]|uniref:Shiga toxin A subunit n=1 Tax=Enterobacter sp. P82 TaxID=3123033 RepID=UPI00300BFD0C
MIRILLLALMGLPVFVYASSPDTECAAPGHYMDNMLQVTIKNELGIDIATIQNDKITSDLIDVTPVSYFLAHQLARSYFEADKKRNGGKADLTEKEYFDSFHANGAKSITAKYTYTSTSGKRDVFIASSLFNNDECSVLFNGYLTLSREF